MAVRRQKKRPSYRWRAFAHWLNLAFLATGGVLGAVYDPAVLLAVGPIELGLLWLLPDLPSFRARVDKSIDADDLLQERAYYVEQLWGLTPEEPKSLGQRIAGWFTERKVEDVDHRVIDRHATSFREYQEMRGIITKLRELEQVRGVSIPERDINRFEQVVNGYLRFMIAAGSLAKALEGIDVGELRQELCEIDGRLENAPPNLKAVLLERRRLKADTLERVPKLQATLELFRTRADAIVYQMRNIHGQVLADPGMDVNAFLDDLVERQEILVDPLGALEADQVLHEILHPASQGAKAAGAAARASR